jgi:hypothetical protein
LLAGQCLLLERLYELHDPTLDGRGMGLSQAVEHRLGCGEGVLVLQR